MRSRRLIWLLLSVMLFVTGLYIWRSNSHLASSLAITRPSRSPAPPPTASIAAEHAIHGASPHGLRLTNTATPFGDLVRSRTAILLENALLDTAQPLTLPIPEHLRTQGDPGAYIIQSRMPLDGAFRDRLHEAGAVIVAYIPNQAYLVRASQAVARVLQGDPQTQAVLPYEPYFKLKPLLLALAVQEQPLPANQLLNLLLFSDANSAVHDELKHLGVQVLDQERSPFGPVLKVRLENATILPALARLASMQELELSHVRVLANDLSRARIAVATDSTISENYLGLTGTNVLVNVNDSGVDMNHPDLQGRILFDAPISGVDSNGHGTHVAAIIAGSGLESPSVTNARGSVMPGTNLQFRGKAPGAQVFAIATEADPGPASDSRLQEAAARTNAFISNNSWHYANANTYDLAAARYDAAVRDALPEVSGSQPLVFVFGAGNAGNGADDGSGGDPDTIQSPATAKNVITVGAITQPRWITNEAWQCTTVNETNVCVTNQPWLALTATNDAVTAFSSRGSVGVGLEGVLGRCKPDLVAPGTFVVSARSAQWDQAAYYGPSDAFSTYSEVFSNLNETLGPFYRYESGTSLAAADASGLLALMQEFFQSYGRTNSPALMKALLINGARPLTAPGGFQVNSRTNSQGWGLINLTNSLPVGLTNAFVQAAAPMQIFDQDASHALATSQSHTRFVSLLPEATNCPLRFTLVWTDPPGNPVASLKLVNNLDLVVTNLDTGEVFFGNDILPHCSFNQPWDDGAPPNLDAVNNVENVYLSPPLATNYSVTVLAHSVNVNAVTARTNDIVQDYALVIASGDGQLADALSVAETPINSSLSSGISFIPNSFAPDQRISGGLLPGQRVGANGPSPDGVTIPLPGAPSGVITLGLTNQWRFYILTNDFEYTNAAFLTFLPSILSLPRFEAQQTNPAPPEADIDLYVSADAGLTNLEPLAVAEAWNSLGRGGVEMVVLSNTAPGLYYVGVKAESGHGAEFGFVGVFSELPFAETDAQGNQVLRGFPAPALIPEGSSNDPASALVFGLSPQAIPLRRVVVTNTLSHESPADLLGTLSHLGTAVVLNKHSPYLAATNQSFVYDDSNENDVPGAQHTDGPGSLRNFALKDGAGQWLLTLASTNRPGTNDSLVISLEPQPPLTTSANVSVLPGASREDYLEVPPNATNLTITVDLLAGFGPLKIEVCPLDASSNDCQAVWLTAPATSSSIVVDNFRNPPLNTGVYAVRLCNQGSEPIAATVGAAFILESSDLVRTLYSSAGLTPILDDAVSVSSIFVTQASPIVSAEVGVRIDHPRISDLTLTLVSPDGTRVLLDQNRGGASPEGMGLNVALTNTVSTNSSYGPEASTNIIYTPSTAGTVAIGYRFFNEEDTISVYYGTNLTPANRIFESPPVINDGTFEIAFGPGDSTAIAIVIDEGRPLTAWDYDLTIISPAFLHTTFTENTNLTVTPIKFASPPFTNLTLDPVTLAPAAGIFYLPEESLDKLTGELALGDWTLEVVDNRSGAADPPPALLSWQLSFVFQDVMPQPRPLAAPVPQTNTVAPGRIEYYSVQAPLWARFATNSLLAASAPVNLLFNQDILPAGTNSTPPDFLLLSGATNGTSILAPDGDPPRLVPGVPYFLGVQNTNSTAVTFALAVRFDITPLVSGVPVAFDLPPGPAPRYFSFQVETNATAAEFQLLGLSGNANLVVRKAPPLPTLNSLDYGSFYPGTNSEQIIIFTNTAPTPLSPGRWHIGVFNDSDSNVTGVVLAAAYTDPVPEIIPLYSDSAYANINPGPAGFADFYRYLASSDARRIQFEIAQPTGDLTLVARKGLPLPTLTSFDLLSANPGINDELIVFYDFSSPIPLSPGEWFLSAVSISGGPASYLIKATEHPAPNTNIVITGIQDCSNGLCLTWTSVPGIRYHVEAKQEVTNTFWATISPTIIAEDFVTTHHVTLPSSYHFFRVAEGLVVTPYVPPVPITSITLSTNGVRLQWSAPTNSQFQAQWTPSLAPPDWIAFTNILTSTNGDFSFLDDGSQGGDPAGSRYYRLRQLP
ncbi:MAG TPA: S8 family serine peptidase [Candidatus Paceibacterota bacterium]|nr:S8 family serine peptidase [Verrucomicrobiota bacterium]HSA09250.1 S8 family serine peptidase [Candidatus Paceibacterota bacterium]